MDTTLVAPIIQIWVISYLLEKSSSFCVDDTWLCLTGQILFAWRCSGSCCMRKLILSKAA